MSTCMPVTQGRWHLASTVRQFSRCMVGDSPKASSPCGSGVYSVQRLPTDALGTTTINLTNLVSGSAIRIEVASTGALVASRTAGSGTEAFSLDYYASGDANNDIRIKVRKGSAAPLYKPYETQATLGAAAQSIFIAQIPD